MGGQLRRALFRLQGVIGFDGFSPFATGRMGECVSDELLLVMPVATVLLRRCALALTLVKNELGQPAELVQARNVIR